MVRGPYCNRIRSVVSAELHCKHYMRPASIDQTVCHRCLHADATKLSQSSLCALLCAVDGFTTPNGACGPNGQLSVLELCLKKQLT